MKILFISNLFGKYARGGAESVVEERMREMNEQNNNIALVTSKPIGKILDHNDETNKWFRIYSFFPLNIFFYANLLKHSALIRLLWHVIDMFNVYSMIRMFLIFCHEKPDEIYSHNLKGIGLVTPLAIRLFGSRWIHNVHDIQLITPSGLMLYKKENSLEHTNLLTRLYRVWCRFVFGSPDEVRFPSEWCKKYYEQFGFFKNSKRIVIKNTARYITNHERISIRRTNSNQAKKFIYAGQLERHKGIRELVKTFLMIPHLTLNIYGSGSLEKEMRELAKDVSNIYFFDRVSREELQKAYELNDVLVCPSLCYENAPMAIIEAKANGLRIIASNIGGIPELLDDNDILVEPGNVSVLVDVISQI